MMKKLVRLLFAPLLLAGLILLGMAVLFSGSAFAETNYAASPQHAMYGCYGDTCNGQDPIGSVCAGGTWSSVDDKPVIDSYQHQVGSLLLIVSDSNNCSSAWADFEKNGNTFRITYYSSILTDSSDSSHTYTSSLNCEGGCTVGNFYAPMVGFDDCSTDKIHGYNNLYDNRNTRIQTNTITWHC